MLIKDIFMELRSRLRSCNVYIRTSVDFTKNCNLKISIQANCIVLNYYLTDDKRKRRDSLSSIESLSDCYSEDDSDVTMVIPIEEFCQIIPNSMSCLKIDKSNISFRILTEPKNGGNFYTEIITSSQNEIRSKKNEMNINVKVNETLKLSCANCSNVVSNDEVKFDRILELPSSNMDMSEWFCHGHGHGNTMPNSDVLQPNRNDFLYRLTYFMINTKSLSEKTNKFNSKRSIYHCNRCLAWLGLKSKDSVKMFNSELKINQNGVEMLTFSHKNTTHNCSTDDFIYTIENIVRDFDLGYQFTVMCKLVLESTITSSKKQYLLIWVMDKELQVLRNIDKAIGEKIKLQSSFLTKILYKVELSLNEEVESWISDPGVVTTEISKSMFSNGLEHLQEMSLKVPEMFRTANGYCVSYLKA